MRHVRDMISNISQPDARSAIYYVSRYVKQAEYFEKYKKDVFEEVYESAPSEDIWSLAVAMISAIESEEGAKIAELSDQRNLELLEELLAIEDELVPEPSSREAGDAEEFIKRMETPAPKKLS
ncbi:hypothetical protein PMI09_04417 [Rhizobium sp. CF122]|uniref:hypothetical protein n=1 Tax=Rhizobium sp. CF122 TaxID=1144312 RepID=UPI000271A982|nr:hypothetical protein [Rhizobium sp. CF122]EJL51627.1 hypothetical protein PMI09_04417 [Rhizobium sp. CF122]